MRTTFGDSTVQLLASSRTWLDGEATRQLWAAAALPGVQLAVGFPGLHRGPSGPIGAAFVTEGVIHPSLIGGDIGCGLALFRTEQLRRKAKLDRWVDLPFDLEHPWEGNVRERLAGRDLVTTQFSERFGTLGGGHHFAELQAVEKVADPQGFAELGLAREQLLLLVHSGSRGLGQAVLESHVEEHGAAGLDARSDAATALLLGHDHAVQWAAGNRALIAERFLGTLGCRGELVLDHCHNAIACRKADGKTRWLHRKGATPAERGPVVIPGTRGSFSYLVRPLENGEAHGWSVAHGAGRKWPRTEARARMRERFRAMQLIQTGLGGRVICEDRRLLYEEAPPAYKNIETVIEDLAEAGLISVIATLRPLLTYKTRLERT